MKIATVHLKSLSPYSASRHFEAVRGPKESPDDVEKRTWREKAHYDEEGMCFIPGMAFKYALARAAVMIGMKIKGRGTSTYVKHFAAGVQVYADLPLGVHKDKVKGETFWCHANGKRGSGSRVHRTFPVFPSWSGELEYVVVDSTITEDVFERHLRESGLLVGIGRFRPENMGRNGCFDVTKVKWREHG